MKESFLTNQLVSVERFPTVVSKWDAKRRLSGEGKSEGADDPNDTGGEGESTESS